MTERPGSNVLQEAIRSTVSVLHCCDRSAGIDGGDDDDSDGDGDDDCIEYGFISAHSIGSVGLSWSLWKCGKLT